MPRRDWRPARLNDRDITQILLTFGVIGLVRGWDYLTGDDQPTPTQSMIEAAAPFAVWGVACFVGGVVLLTGRALRCHTTIWAGHSILSVTYGLLGLGIVLSAADEPWLDGIRGAGVLLAVALVHNVIARRMGARPITHEQATPTETVEAA